jgi:sensor histidine kinase YesM
MILTGRFLSAIGSTYAQNARLYDFLHALEAADYNYQAYLRSKSDVSLESYYRSANVLRQSLNLFNKEILDNPTALLERDITRLSESYLEATERAIAGRRARDIEAQREALSLSNKACAYIRRYVEELDQIWFEGNYNYYTETSEKIAFMRTLSAFLSLLVFSVNALFFIAFIRFTTKPLLLLSKNSDEVSRGNYDIPPLDIDTGDEISLLAKTFDKMLEGIRENMSQIEKNNHLEKYLQEARYSSLQAQVKPHFLFNCLNAAAQLAMFENADAACRFIERLADFYRGNLGITGEDAMLRGEIDLVLIYVDIMRVRFGDGFRFEKNIDPDLLDVKVPSLILQPIVENAFNHGIRDMESGGEISLSVRRENDVILICVKDNGKGFPPELLEMDFLDDRPYANGAVHIGILNVARRLALYYGRKGLFEIENGLAGAIVKIAIPNAISK